MPQDISTLVPMPDDVQGILKNHVMTVTATTRNIHGMPMFSRFTGTLTVTYDREKRS